MQVARTTKLVAVRDEVLTTEEEQALVGFLAGYRGLTREAYQLGLRQWVQWCTEREVPLFGACRADIEGFSRHLEARGRARATIARRLCTITCSCRYAEQEGLIPISPAVHVRRPRLDYDSHATGLDRNEVGAMLVAAGLGDAREHALLSLLALNGLRISEALDADIERLGLERGHRTLTVLRKGGKIVTVPLAPRTPSISQSANATKARSSLTISDNGSTVTPPPGSCGASPAVPGSPNESDRTPCGMRSSPPRSTPASPARRPRSGQSRRPPHHDAV